MKKYLAFAFMAYSLYGMYADYKEGMPIISKTLALLNFEKDAETKRDDCVYCHNTKIEKVGQYSVPSNHQSVDPKNSNGVGNMEQTVQQIIQAYNSISK